MNSTRTWRGLTFGGSSAFQIESENGLEDVRVRSGMRTLPRAAGATPGRHDAEPRQVELSLWWFAGSPAASEALTQQLRAVLVPSETDLFRYSAVRADGSERFIRARVARADLPRDQDTEAIGIVRSRVVFEAPDPRLYADPMIGVLVPAFGLAGGGFDWPIDWPLSIDASEPAQATAVNLGNADAYPLIRFEYPTGETGTATGFELVNLTNGDSVEIVTTLAAGQILTVDMDALMRATGDLVVHIGGSDRYGAWQTPRAPFRLSPGTNFVRFNMTGDAPIRARVDWRHTSL